MSTKCKEILEELAIPCNYIEGLQFLSTALHKI